MTLQRQIRVTSTPVVIDTGVISIDVTKTLDPSPPEGKVIFRNLSRSTEEQFEIEKSITIEAGQERLQTIYKGLILRIAKKVNKPESGFEMRLSSYISNPVPRFRGCLMGLTPRAIVSSLIEQLKMPAGDLSAVPINSTVEEWCWQGTVAEGLTNVLRNYSLTWYIDEGRVSVASPDTTNPTLSSLVINATTGMVGSPEPTDTGLKVKVLLDTPVALNQLVEVESSSYIYGYDNNESELRDTRKRQRLKVFGMRYSGDNWGGSFTNELRLESLQPISPTVARRRNEQTPASDR